MELTFSGEVWFWRGPAPWHFVTLPEDDAEALATVADRATYGWGMIPVRAEVGRTRFATSLWPKDGSYIVPLKVAVRKAEGIELGDVVTVRISVDL